MSATAASTADREILSTRVFDAPRELVFKMWTDPRHLVKWWGPKGFTTTIHEMDVKPGGTWRFVMHGPDGTGYLNNNVYVEIVTPELLVYDHASTPKFRMSVTFANRGAKTEVSVQMLFESAALLDQTVKQFGAVEGLAQTLDRLKERIEEELAGEMVLTRIFDAPRDLVFKAWTDPEHLQRWWGPKSFTNPICEVDPRPGGAIRVHMRAPDGTVYPMAGVYREVAPPERIVFSSSALDDKGNPLFEVLNTVTFFEQAGKTRLIVRATVTKTTAAAPQYLAGMEQGWSQSLDRLAEQVARKQPKEFSITRVFDAPRDLVWKAVTESGHLTHWWGPKGFTMLVCDVDLHPGGVFRYAMKAPNGHEMWGKWVYREIVPPERLVSVVSFTDESGNLMRHPMSPTWPLEVLNIMTLSEQGGKTSMTVSGHPINATEEECKTYDEGHGSMKQGFTGTFDQLEAYLARRIGS